MQMHIRTISGIHRNHQANGDGKLNPHIPAMQACLANVMGCDADQVSIKATTTEKLGFTGRQEGISAYAVCLVEKVR